MISLCCHLIWEYDGNGSTGNGGGVTNCGFEYANWNAIKNVKEHKK